jgi:predicted 3-demethylubiquinone-9 3-methyltransferase (glyoxalase superfamily)
MTHELGTCLWFDKKAKDAFLFYKDVFGEVELLSENPMAVVYKKKIYAFKWWSRFSY